MFHVVVMLDVYAFIPVSWCIFLCNPTLAEFFFVFQLFGVCLMFFMLLCLPFRLCALQTGTVSTVYRRYGYHVSSAVIAAKVVSESTFRHVIRKYQ